MKRLIILFVSVLLAFQLTAQENENNIRKITVDDAVILAADNNISLKRKKINLDTLERRNNTAWNVAIPSASVSGSVTKPLEGIATEMKPQLEYTYNIGASASLRLTPALYSSIRDAMLKYESGKTSYEQAVRELELNVRKLFYNLLYTRESINLQKRNMETARIRYENNRDKYNRGQLSELDLLQSQYNYESQRPSIESAEIAYQNSIASFKQTLGIPQNEKIELSGSIYEALPKDSITISQNIEELPSIKNIKDSIAQQKNSILATRFSAYGPSVSASYSWGLNGNNKTEELKQHQESHSISLGVNIPLDGFIPWSSGAQSVTNQKATLKDLELQLENERTTAELTVQNSIKNIVQKQSQMELLDRNVELAQKSYDMTLTAYNHGSKDLLTLQNSSDALLKAKLERELHIYNLMSAVLDLENTLGIPFGSLGDK